MPNLLYGHLHHTSMPMSTRTTQVMHIRYHHHICPCQVHWRPLVLYRHSITQKMVQCTFIPTTTTTIRCTLTRVRIHHRVRALMHYRLLLDLLILLLLLLLPRLQRSSQVQISGSRLQVRGIASRARALSRLENLTKIISHISRTRVE